MSTYSKLPPGKTFAQQLRDDDARQARAEKARAKKVPSKLVGSGSSGSTDRRSPLARARDDFLQSDEGAKCCDPTTLKAPSDQRQYLENRIARAFLAGVDAAEKLAKAGQ